MQSIFHHIAFTVNNLKESIQWYQRKLGFELVHKYKKDGMEFALIKLGQVKIELFNFGKQTKPLPNYRKELMNDLHTIGTKHLCLETENLDKTISDLKKKDVEFVTKIDNASFGGRYIFFKDCNGILIELYSSK